MYDHHLYDWVKKGKGLGDAQHDEGEIEEDDPERRKHLSVKKVKTQTFEKNIPYLLAF